MNRFLGIKGSSGHIYKSMKRDSIGIPTLLSNGKEFNTAKGKASVLNDHFQSVYTSKDLIFQTLAAVFLLYHQ